MEQNQLFEDLPIVKAFNPNEGLTCLTCMHRERHQHNSVIVQYCGVRKCNRTNNGQLKIKCKMAACAQYKKINHE